MQFATRSIVVQLKSSIEGTENEDLPLDLVRPNSLTDLSGSILSQPSSYLSIPLVHKRSHSNIIPLQFFPLLPLRGTNNDYNPKDPRSSCDNAVGHFGALALSRKFETEETVDQSSGDEKAAKPDMNVRVRI